MRALLTSALGAIACFAAGATLAGDAGRLPATASQRWSMTMLDARAIEARCGVEYKRARDRMRAMEKRVESETILAEWNRLSGSVQDFIGPVFLLANAATDAATRDAALACVERFSSLEIEPFQSEKLYARVRGLRPADAIDRQYRHDLLDTFEDAGIALKPDQRKRIKEIREEIDKISLRFQSNVNEDKTVVTIAPEQARGLPQDWINSRKRDAEGRLIVTLDSPTYTSFLDNAIDEAARRDLYMAKMQQGGNANLELLDRVLVLRHEMARLYGYPDFATFSLRRAMAQTPAAVREFLAKVRGAVNEGEARDLDALRADKAAMLGRPVADVTLNRWDVSFHEERVRRSRYQVDQEVLRAYFPSEKSVAFTMRLAELLYGVTFVARDVPRWSSDVRYYDVFERTATGAPGAFIGGIYLDLFPRDGKYNHAAAFTLRSVSTLSGRKPASALVANLDRTGLTQEELETLLHEFGHVLHGVLSKTRYVDHGGTNVKRDFVEAPSQMFEEWARREQPLHLFAEICRECPPLSPQMVERLRKARLFGIGILYARQWQYANYDMVLHTGSPPSALQAWIEIERASRLGHVEGTILPASFGHLVGGYAAGYYGYMWSQVLGLDMLSGFHGRMLDPVAGRRYRKVILEMGGQRPPQELVETFLGRKPNSDAFFAEISGARD
ncbi:MAG TPA: M3 family metallopeptidase [Burkholderiaceae bacterium]|nr:M3 family metallopeptidase [Burkholderiaceae bacterium]